MIPLENRFGILEFEHFWCLRHICGDSRYSAYVKEWKCTVCSVKAGEKVQLMYKLWGLNHTNFEEFNTDDVDVLTTRS